MAYLGVLTDARAFPDPRPPARPPSNALTTRRPWRWRCALSGYALADERNGRLVPEKDARIVDELASEEQAHLVTLTEAQRRLGV